MGDEEQKSIELQRLEFEREKHRDEIQLKCRELELRAAQERRSSWHSPLFLAVAAAIIGLLSNAVVAWLNGSSQRELEDKKAEAARIIEALKTGDPDVAAENLNLLVEAGLVRESANDIRAYLKKRNPGEGARLPVAVIDTTTSGAPSQPSTNSQYCDKYLKDGAPSDAPQFCRIGYAFGFNRDRHLAEWVIYRISADRPNPRRQRVGDRWYFDLELPVEAQAGDGAYVNNEWDRGQLIYRLDATWSDKAYNEIWLFSVTAPQHKDLNRGLWSSLERLTSDGVAQGKVRELYIIAGPVFGRKTETKYRGMVDIPDGFYRIAYDPLGNRVSAWLLPNGPVGESQYPGINGLDDPLLRYVVSIDIIEKLTKLDFFNALPHDVEATLEASATPPDWLR